ncbi:MAG: adenylosuccinate synthase [Sphaerobacteraceae bacterium]|nr:MAG: adenylosuccinate synthase [Sphaerobacteraceae bacterium]
MSVTIVIGGQWGDEGKGKITDALASQADMVVRPNGSANAGHTVQTDAGIFKLHLVPSGILYPDCDCVIGAGVAIDPVSLIGELDELESRGIDTSRVAISDRATVILPYHPILDRLEEQSRGDQNIGTTLKGNGPAYADKVGRRGLRIADLADEKTFVQRLRLVLNEKNVLLQKIYNADPLDESEILETYSACMERLAPYIVQSEIVVQDAIDAGKRVVIEGAQATLLDIDYGSYPYVTSTSPTAAGACQGAGVGPGQIDRTIGVYKAYITRVGGGPFPTEDHGENGEIMRQRGKEFGTTTGRPRRTGWFDGPAARYAARINGLSEIAITKLDILDEFDQIPVCTGYRLDGEIITSPVASAVRYGEVEPVYEYLEGWKQDTSASQTLDDLPPAARAYIDRLEQIIGRPVTYIGIGPSRSQIVERAATV